MPKVTRRLGQDRVTPEHLAGIKAPERLPNPDLNISLDELLARTESVEATLSPTVAETLQNLPLELIDPSPYQPRLTLSETQLDELVDSIQATGLLHPILVRAKHARYELIGGERRWRAHQRLNRTHILARVCNLNDGDAEVAALADNEGQASLTDYERGKRFHEILARGIESSQRALARRISVNVSTISRCLAFMQLPDVARAVLNEAPNLIGARHVKDFVIHGSSQPEQLRVALLKIKEDGWTQEAALRWLQRQKQNSVVEANTTKPARTIGGVGKLQIQGQRIQLQCANNINSEKIAQLLEAFLANLSEDQYQDS